jgi:hypothetical protein
MTLYRVEVQIGATAYIKAETLEAAMKIANEMKDDSIYLPDDLGLCGDVEITGMQFDNPDLPDVSLSPAMTVLGPWPGCTGEEVE